MCEYQPCLEEEDKQRLSSIYVENQKLKSEVQNKEKQISAMAEQLREGNHYVW